MIPEYLVKKYNYTYVQSCNLLNEPFVKDLLKELKEANNTLDIYNELIECLKKKLEEIEKKYIPEYIKESTKNILLKKQQQEFVKYLDDMLDDENDIFSVIRVKDVLNKYKSTIGGNKDE